MQLPTAGWFALIFMAGQVRHCELAAPPSQVTQSVWQAVQVFSSLLNSLEAQATQEPIAGWFALINLSGQVKQLLAPFPPSQVRQLAWQAEQVFSSLLYSLEAQSVQVAGVGWFALIFLSPAQVMHWSAFAP